MKVVALVSGGKDSCYAMMRCVDYGHEIVALANLMPMDDAVDELDSYMYQTVGHQILVSYAECMGLPLFRRRIQGSTRHKHLGYKMTSGDEVEDMFLLLKEVKEKIPSITAVSSGAIASDYQRLRVESVCSRLGLVSLSYLWKQDQTLLLEEMIRREVIAITIKVAAMGLTPAKHLGKQIMDLHDPLHQLKELYGINVCGEGGEYETLTLDCPLFRNARIVLNDYKIIMHSMDSIAPVGILHPLSFHLESKVGNSLIDTSDGHETIQRKAGPVFEVLGDSIQTQLANCSYEENTPNSCASKMKALHVTTRKHTFLISCWNPCYSSNGLEDDLTANLRKVESQLGAYGFGWANVLYIHLYISDMDSFALANEVYLRFITENRCPMGVPSRSCIELPLVQAGLGNSYIEVLVADDDTKNVLHVQSISCWAPSCIGPYSQATLHKEILYMAGQLGLDPPTMKLCSGGPAAEFQQALDNCNAVIRCFNSSISSGILFVIYCSASLTSADRLDVQCMMEKFLSEGASKNQNEKPSDIPDPIFIYVLAPALPKRAYVEVKPVLYVPESRQASTPIFVKDDQGCIGMLPTWDLEPLSLTDSCSQKFIISGRICAFVVSISGDVAAELCSISNQGTPDYSCYKFEKNIKRISRFCVCHLHRTLLENNFSWSELTSLRIYFAMSHIALETLRNVFRETFVELSEITDGIPRSDEETIFSLVPVLSAGRNANMGDLITCELFASKL